MKNGYVLRTALAACALVLALVCAGCPAPFPPPGSGSAETTMAASSAIADVFTLNLGTWSDNLASRTSTWNSGAVAASASTPALSVAAGSYTMWIRLGASDYKFIRSGTTAPFALAAGNDYTVTVNRNSVPALSWTLTYGSVSEAGTMLEYPDTPPPGPARLTVVNHHGATVRVQAGVWSNSFNDRQVLAASNLIGSNATLVDWTLTAGSYHLWLVKNGKLYPLLDGNTPRTFAFEAGGIYEIVLDPAAWTGTGQTGGISAVGWAEALPGVPSYGRSPSDNGTGVWLDAAVSWLCSSNTAACDLFLDTTDGSTLVAADLTSYRWSPALEYSTTYYWKVTAKNNSGEFTSPVFSFTTVPPLIPSLSSPDAGETNQPKVEIAVDFNVDITADTLTADDFTVTGGAVVTAVGQETNSRFRVYLTMPSVDAPVTVTLPANLVKDSYRRRDNIPSNTLSFGYFHFPVGELENMIFQADGRAVWALDNDNARLIRYDVPRRVILHAWSLPHARPVSLDRVGNVLYIIYADVNAVSRFAVDQAVPGNSGFVTPEFAIPLRAGNTFEAAFTVKALPERSQLAIAYQDSAWPKDHCICVISSIDGAAAVAPVLAGGNSSGRYLDYAAGRLATVASGISNGPLGVYTAGPTSLAPLVSDTEMDTFIDYFDLDDGGTRIATFCTNRDLVPNETNMMYNIYDLGIENGALVYRGAWRTGDYCTRPIFSHDGRFMYITSRDDNFLMVFRADNGSYDKIRDLPFPSSKWFENVCQSPDGTQLVGFSYDWMNKNNYRFYVFSDIRD